MTKTPIVSLCALFLFVAIGCNKEDLKTSTSVNAPILAQYDYSSANKQSFAFGSIADDKAALGRILFYDNSLSLTNSVSCASCHIQSKGFTDGLALSKGFNNQETPLHSMAIVNMGASSSFFWDGRAHDLRSQVMMPIANHIEMGIENEQLLVDKVNSLDYYQDYFNQIYGVNVISSEQIGDALGTFVASIASTNTKWDKVNNQQASFTPSEQRGLELFNHTYDCASCHGGVNFNASWGFGGGEMANIGLDLTNENDLTELKFSKVPTLRNIAVTGPYMHDGRFSTLEDVLDHYSQGIQPSKELDWRLRDQQTGEPLRMNIPTQDKKDIIAFLKTLTDEEVLTHPRFSSPF